MTKETNAQAEPKAADPRKIYLKNVSVVFANLEDEGFGRSITIDATDEDVKLEIEKWVHDNNIGKAPNTGKANFKTYEDRLQYAFKINDSTKFVYAEGLSSADLGYRAEVSLAANAFDYDNKFGKGTSSSLSAVVVHKGKATGADADIEELMGAEGTPVNLDEQPF